VIDLPSLEKTNGRYGYAGTVAPRSKNSAYAVNAVAALRLRHIRPSDGRLPGIVTGVIVIDA
jgi:hypothetical protein